MKINRALGAIIFLIALKIMFGDIFSAFSSSAKHTASTYDSLMTETRLKIEE